jgi:putative flippase GtrA
MPLQTFRYVACGGGNMVLGLSIYFVLFNYVFTQGYVSLGSFAFESYNVSLFFSSCTCFIVGFLLNKYVVFTTSYLKGRIQLFRYFLSFSFNLLLNYFLLKLFVKILGMDEFLAQLISTLLGVTIAFVTQKYFTFKHEKA